MDYKRVDDQVVVRLDPGDKVIQSIEQICEKTDIKTGSFTGIGALNQATLRFFLQDEKDFIEETFEQQFEMTALTGNITTVNNDPYIHAHVVLADNSFRSRTGHFHEGTVGATAEITIIETNDKITREFSEDIGLDLYKL